MFCFVFLFFYYLVVDKKKIILTTCIKLSLQLGEEREMEKNDVLAYQDVVLDGRSYIFNLSSGDTRLVRDFHVNVCR